MVWDVLAAAPPQRWEKFKDFITNMSVLRAASLLVVSLSNLLGYREASSKLPRESLFLICLCEHEHSVNKGDGTVVATVLKIR